MSDIVLCAQIERLVGGRVDSMVLAQHHFAAAATGHVRVGHEAGGRHHLLTIVSAFQQTRDEPMAFAQRAVWGAADAGAVVTGNGHQWPVQPTTDRPI